MVNSLRTRHLIRLILVLSLACLARATPGGQGSGSDARSDASVFRASAQLIRLDVSVTDAAGTPVADLQSADFEVLQDGRRQRVQFANFQAVDLTAKGPLGPSGAATALPADTGIGVKSDSGGAGGRRLVFIVDDRWMDFDSLVRTREYLTRIAEDRLLPDARLMIVGTEDGTNTPLSFSTDRAVLLREVQALRWQPRLRNQTDQNMASVRCLNPVLTEEFLEPRYTRGTLGVLASVLRQLRTYPGRKSILVLADDLDVPCVEYRQSFDEQLRRLSDLAGRSSAVIYGLQTKPFSSGVQMPERRATAADVTGPMNPAPLHNELGPNFRKLAEPTGGFARRSNSVSDLVGAALPDEDGYYVIAYEPPPGTFTGQKLRYRKLTVHVNRQGLSVRTRAGFYSVEDDSVLIQH